jgi:hypothetical protein
MKYHKTAVETVYGGEVKALRTKRAQNMAELKKRERVIKVW